MSGAALFACAVALAHHSFAMFELDREVVITGTVKEFQWTNPHVWIQLLIADDQGVPSEWGLEMGAPGMLTRTGWKSSMLKPMDHVSVIIHPRRDGRPGGSVVKVTLPDGRMMGPGGGPPPLPPR